MRRINLHLVQLDPAYNYPPHALITDRPEPLQLTVDLAAGQDLRLLFVRKPHSAVAYTMGSTYREQSGVRASFFPMIGFDYSPDTDTLLTILNCCKWSERLLGADWETDGIRYRVYGCRLTEHYLLEFIYHLYRAGGFVVPGQAGESRSVGRSLPFHIDLLEGRALGLDPDTVGEIRHHYARDLVGALGTMTDEERAWWGISGAPGEIERR